MKLTGEMNNEALKEKKKKHGKEEEEEIKREKKCDRVREHGLPGDPSFFSNVVAK